MNEECWRPIVGYEGLYEVSDQGRVRTMGRSGVYAGRWGDVRMQFAPKVMKLGETPTGYWYVTLKKPNEKGVKHQIHRLVMRAFVGEHTPERPQVNHKNGNKADNRVENLEYCSAKENLLHLTQVLGRKVGGNGAHAKLRPDQVRAILSDDRTLKEIGRDYGVSLQAIWYIKKGRNWGHLQTKEQA